MSVWIQNAANAATKDQARTFLGPNGAEPERMSDADKQVKRWYALAVRARCEKGVSAELLRQNIEVFLPMTSEKRVWGDRLKTVETALFPGYVFVRTHMQGRERFRIVDAHDVIQVVGRHSGTIGLPIPDSEIDSVRTLVRHAAKVETCALLPGARVKIWRGPLKGVEGMVQEEQDGKKHIVCAISLLGRAVRTTLDVLDIVAIS